MKHTLAVHPRAAANLDDLRAAGKIPAVVYGPKQNALPIEVEAKAFETLRKEATESTIVSLEGLADDSLEVLIKDIDFNPVRQNVQHIDFYAIERGKDMTTTVALEFVGEAPIEKSSKGTVTKVIHEITVTCRPSKLPSEIMVDISGLTSVEDKITVADLPTLDGVTYEAEAEDPIAVVAPAKTEEEVDSEPAEVDMNAIEVEQKGKDETTED